MVSRSALHTELLYSCRGHPGKLAPVWCDYFPGLGFFFLELLRRAVLALELGRPGCRLHRFALPPGHFGFGRLHPIPVFLVHQSCQGRSLAGSAGPEASGALHGAWPVAGAQPAHAASCASALALPHGLEMGSQVARSSRISPWASLPASSFSACVSPPVLNALVFSPRPRITREEAQSYLVCSSRY